MNELPLDKSAGHFICPADLVGKAYLVFPTPCSGLWDLDVREVFAEQAHANGAWALEITSFVAS